MSLSFSDRAVIRLPAVMMNGRGEVAPGEARCQSPCPSGRATGGRDLGHRQRGRRAPAGRGARRGLPAVSPHSLPHGRAAAARPRSAPAPAAEQREAHRGAAARALPAGKSRGGARSKSRSHGAELQIPSLPRKVRLGPPAPVT